MRSGWIAATAAALATVACAGGGQPAGPGPAPIPSRREPPLAVAEAGLRHPEPNPWQEARLVDARTLDVYYVGNAAGCLALSDVRVTETADVVTVTLSLGMRAEVSGDSCPLGGVDARTRVTLRAPLGERRVVDGGASSPAERPVVHP